MRSSQRTSAASGSGTTTAAFSSFMRENTPSTSVCLRVPSAPGLLGLVWHRDCNAAYQAKPRSQRASEGNPRNHAKPKLLVTNIGGVSVRKRHTNHPLRRNPSTYQKFCQQSCLWSPLRRILYEPLRLAVNRLSVVAHLFVATTAEVSLCLQRQAKGRST